MVLDQFVSFLVIYIRFFIVFLIKKEKRSPRPAAGAEKYVQKWSKLRHWLCFCSFLRALPKHSHSSLLGWALLGWARLGCVLSSVVFGSAVLGWTVPCYALLGLLLAWGRLASAVLGSVLLRFGSAGLGSCSAWLGSVQVVFRLGF